MSVLDAASQTAPPDSEDTILARFLQAVAVATSMVDVNIAAGIALQELADRSCDVL